MALVYSSAFFRTYLGNETEFIPVLTGTAPPPVSAMTDQIHVSFHAPDDSAMRLDVNRLNDGENLISNTLGDAVIQTGLNPYELCGGDFGERLCLVDEPSYRQPHNDDTFLLPDVTGLSQVWFGWDSMSSDYENLLPPDKRDVSGFSLIQFRVGLDFADPRNPAGLPQDFSVMLTNGNGDTYSVRVSEHSQALYYPPGDSYIIPKVILNTVPIPLAAFGGIDLTDIYSVRFDFDREQTGALLITDLAFSNAGDLTEPPVGSVDLSLEMTDSPDPVRLGKELTYRIIVTNLGTDTATGVILFNSLPPEVSFKQATDGCSYASGGISCPPIDLPAGEFEEYEFIVKVEESPADGRLQNTASVAAEQSDPDGSNNIQTVSTRVVSSGGGGKPR